MALLEIKDLEVFYGVIQALKGISFSVDEGEIITLIGANGAGKTTTMQSVIGLIQKKAGTVTYNGENITQTPAHKLVGKGMAQVPEGRRIFQELTVYENLLMGAIAELTKNKTVIMIAHRLKTVRNADQIFVLSGGHIVQTGKHEDLIRQPGIYADFIGIRKKAIGWKLK